MSDANTSQDSGSYVLDAENVAEMARLLVQDRLLTEAMGGTLSEQSHETLKSIQRLLDIGCGPAGWALTVANEYPSINVVGIDISNQMIQYAHDQVKERDLYNAEFLIMDATQPLRFPDHHFDLINGRILTGFLTTTGWPLLLQECWRTTRPGGILRLSEPEFGFTNSEALDALTELSAQALRRAGHTFSPRGRTFGTTPLLRSFLQQAGYKQIQQRAHVVDFSAGTPLHERNKQNLLIVYRLLEPFLVQMQGITEVEFSRLYTQLQHDLQQEQFCGLDYYLTVWGYKTA